MYWCTGVLHSVHQGRDAGVLVYCRTLCTLAGVPIITVAATKGGVGKTTLAYELAAALGGVLVDLDWDSGGATRMWGYDPASYRRAPLLDALESGPSSTAPRPRARLNQPFLLPSSPDLAASSIADDLVADCLEAWSKTWSDSMGAGWTVVDTHPGANPLTDGAMQAAQLVIVPVVLAEREMQALRGMLRDYAGYPILLVPNRVPAVMPRAVSRRYLGQLRTLANGIPVAPAVSEHLFIARRLRHAAVVLEPRPGQGVRAAAEEYRAVATTVEGLCG